ncbi:MAG: hypothetical protein E7Z84_00835 [Methanosphaera stadtmanae]|nr:hypothetical protein [Methanosphaera stadtmanae]
MDLNKITKGKSIPLGIIIIIITYLISGLSTSVAPFILFTGILIGLMNSDDIKEAAVASFLASLIASVIVIIISLSIMTMSYGMAYVAYFASPYILYGIMYVIAGVIGGIIGYYISNEINLYD